MPTNAKELGLGTVFTGKVDSTFTTAVSKLKSILHELTNLQAQIKKTTSGSKTGMTLTNELSDYAKAQGNAVNEMTRYRQALAQVKAMHGETGTAFQTAKGQLNQVERAVQATARSMNVAGSEGKEWAKTIDRTSLMNGILSGDLKATTKGFQSVTAAGQAQLQTMGVAEHETRKFGATAQQTGKHAAFMGGQIGWASGTLDRLGRAIKVVAAYSVAGAGFYALTAGIGGATTEIVGFDQALKGVQAITQATTAEIGVMAGVLKGIAKDTKVGPQEAAQAITLLGQAGLEAKESISAIGPTTTLTVGAMAGMEAAADLLTTTLMAFNMRSVESSRVADVMANAMNKSKLDVEKLRVAFSYVGSSAAEVGLTLEQTAASMMVLSNAGLRASTIGTGLRQILSKLINPNEKLREAYEAHKISMEAINPLTVGWGEALKNLSSVLWDHQKKTVDMGKAYQIFELRGAQAAAVLVRAFKSGDYQKMLEYTYAIGSANEMAATQMEGLGYKLANLGNQAKLAAIAVGDAGLAGTMRIAIDAARGLISWLNGFLSGTAGQMVVQVGAITAAVYGMGKAFQALTSIALANQAIIQFMAGLSLASQVGMTFSTVLGVISAGFMGLVRFLTGPIGIIAGLTALVLWFRRVATENDRLIQKTNEQIVKNEVVATSLQAYSGALKSLHEKMEAGNDVTLEYNGLLKRLIKDHPELTKVVDLTRVAYKDFNQELDAALKKLTMMQAKTGAKDYVTSIMAQTEQVKKLANTTEELSMLDGDVVTIEREMTEQRRGKLDAATKGLESTQQQFILSLREIITSGAATQAQIEALIRASAGFSDEGQALSKVLIDKLGVAMNSLAKDSGEAAAVVEGMPAKFRALFNTLTQLQKFEFLGDYKALNAKIASIKKEFKEAKLGGDVKGAITQAEDAFIEDFKRKIDKTKAMASEELRYESILSGLQTDKREKIEQEYTERKALIERFYQQQFDIVNRNETRLAKLKDQVRTLSTESTKKRDYDLAQLDAEIAESKIDLAKTVAMTQVEIAKRGAAEESQTKKEAQKKEVEITVTALREIAAVREKFSQDTLEMFGETDARTVEAKQKSADAQLAIEKAVTSGTIKELNTRFKYDLDMTKKHLLEKYRAGEVSGQDFLRMSLELKEAGQLDEEEFARRQVAVQGTVWEKINHGLQRSRGEIQQWGEFWIATGERVADSLASNLTDGFMGLIERTKTAKEAFADFARSTLKWITEIMAKQLILKALGGIMSLFGNSPASTTVSLSGGSLAPNIAHSGWKAGGGSGVLRRVDSSTFLGAPRFHSGLNPGEIPAILQTGERVLSRRQNAQYEAGAGSLSTSNNAGAEQGAVHLHFDKIQIIANDPLSFAQMIRRDPRTFASMFAEGVTRGDMGIIQSIREATGR